MDMSKYPGSKTGSGILQWLINDIPAHKAYYELFAGSAALYRAKRPAEWNVLNDIDRDTYKRLLQIKKGNSLLIENLSYQTFLDNGHLYSEDTFMFLDPPYPASARRNGRAYYRHEMLTDAEHEKLLLSIQNLRANIMIATRENDLYNDMLWNWRKEKFLTADRAGAVYEIVFCNYGRPTILHQYDYLGDGFTDRQRIKRKITRFSKKIQELPTHEKHLFIQELIQQDMAAVKHFMAML